MKRTLVKNTYILTRLSSFEAILLPFVKEIGF